MENEPSKLVSVLMKRDGLSRAEAEEWVEEGRRQVFEDEEDPEEILEEEFGLEPDYVLDLLGD